MTKTRTKERAIIRRTIPIRICMAVFIINPKSYFAQRLEERRERNKFKTTILPHAKTLSREEKL